VCDAITSKTKTETTTGTAPATAREVARELEKAVSCAVECMDGDHFAIRFGSLKSAHELMTTTTELQSTGPHDHCMPAASKPEVPSARRLLPVRIEGIGGETYQEVSPEWLDKQRRWLAKSARGSQLRRRRVDSMRWVECQCE
jgi:hypothetical protein